MRGIDADVLGLDGRWFDPVWRIEVELTPLEQELLGTWWVRRLAYVAHAGAASMTTTQNYSRLEHSLGVLALVAHFAPTDHLARATALLHDVGHLPFSHSLEGIGGLEHHTIGRARIAALDPVLQRHGLSSQQVIAIDEGTRSSPLRNSLDALKLDHLDSFLRSGQAHGRTETPPRQMLERLRLLDGAIDTDPGTAQELVALITAEARHQRAASNVVPIAVLRHLVDAAIGAGAISAEEVTPESIAENADTAGGLADTVDPASSQSLATLTDDELWAVLLSCPATRGTAREFRGNPGRWGVLASAPPGSADHNVDGAPSGDLPLVHEIHRGYLALPRVDGAALMDPGARDLERELPLRYEVVRR